MCSPRTCHLFRNTKRETRSWDALDHGSFPQLMLPRHKKRSVSVQYALSACPARTARSDLRMLFILCGTWNSIDRHVYSSRGPCFLPSSCPSSHLPVGLLFVCLFARSSFTHGTTLPGRRCRCRDGDSRVAKRSRGGCQSWQLSRQRVLLRD